MTNLDRLKAISGLHDCWSDVGFGALKGGGKDESPTADTSVNWSWLVNEKERVNTNIDRLLSLSL